MRRHCKFLIGFLTVIIMHGCNKATFLRPEHQWVEFSKKGGEKHIFIDCDGNWSIDKCPNWINATRDGDSLIVTCDESVIKSQITDTLFIKAGHLHQGITLVQNGVATFLRLVPESVRMQKEGGTQTIQVLTDGDNLKIQYDENLKVSLLDNCITINSDCNNSTWVKKNVVYVKSDYLQATLEVIQDGKESVAPTPTHKNTNIDPCEECGGAGKLLEEISLETGEKIYRKCDVCNGTGIKIK